MIDFIINLVPWYVWAVLALVIAVLVHKTFGWRNALVAASVLFSAVFAKFNMDKGYKRRKEEEKSAHDKLKKTFKEIDDAPLDSDSAFDQLRGMRDPKDPSKLR